MSLVNGNSRTQGKSDRGFPCRLAFGRLVFLLAGRTAGEQQTALTGAWQTWQ
jgi:hypothetical protein